VKRIVVFALEDLKSGIRVKPVVISTQPKWSRLIRSVEKTIELRRKFPRLHPTRSRDGSR